MLTCRFRKNNSDNVNKQCLEEEEQQQVNNVSNII